MAFYIEILKINETAEFVDYEFGDVGAEKGRLRLDKSTGEVAELVGASADTSGRRFRRAATKVLEHWSKGELPNETCWAS